MAAQLGYWLTHTVVFAWMDSWSKCQYCCMLLWSSVTIIKFENHYCYHTQNKSKNNNKFSKNDKKVRTDNFFNQWLWVTQWLSDLQRYCKQTGLALQPAAWHHFKVIPDSSRTIWPALCCVKLPEPNSNATYCTPRESKPMHIYNFFLFSPQTSTSWIKQAISVFNSHRTKSVEKLDTPNVNSIVKIRLFWIKAWSAEILIWPKVGKTYAN